MYTDGAGPGDGLRHGGVDGGGEAAAVGARPVLQQTGLEQAGLAGRAPHPTHHQPAHRLPGGLRGGGASALLLLSHLHTRLDEALQDGGAAREGGININQINPAQ